MIFLYSSGSMSSSTVGRSSGNHEATTAIYQTVSAPGAEPSLVFDFPVNIADKTEIHPQILDVPEELDWSNENTKHAYIRLEQKVLANKASEEEVKRYQTLKREKNSSTFSDRYVSDYAEIQRLKILSEKIEEIQHYLRPIKLG